MDVGTLRQVGSVLLVFLLLGLAVWKLRQPGSGLRAPWRKSGGTRSLESMERLPLTPQHVLHVVRVHGREVVLATHPQGCMILPDRAESAGV